MTSDRPPPGLTAPVDDMDRASWDRGGVAVLRGVLDEATLTRLTTWVCQLEAMEASPGGPLQHHEQTESGPVMARSEQFADVHPGLGEFVRRDVAALVEAVCCEPVVLFKEKVNYKHPGGGGFAAHQDARAYRFAERHISVMVPLDPATELSGCLWFAHHRERSMLEADERGRIVQSVVEALEWYPVEVNPGDVVVFDSAAPHRSGTNESHHPRRAMYLTYNASAEGDFRHRYYADKQAEFELAGGTFGGDRVRLSISDDFLGRPVPDEPEDPVGHLVALYSSPAAHALYDEAVTELEHALQAARLAELERADDQLVVAALLHDVGHLISRDHDQLDEPHQSDARHERVGAAWLNQHFGAAVVGPIALHVDAKRYLCAVEAGYESGLSPSSVRSLAIQGGPMDDAEMKAFEADPHGDSAVRVRRWDDLAKVPGTATPGFEHFVDVLQRVMVDQEP